MAMQKPDPAALQDLILSRFRAGLQPAHSRLYNTERRNSLMLPSLPRSVEERISLQAVPEQLFPQRYRRSASAIWRPASTGAHYQSLSAVISGASTGRMIT